jgi:hypothetical protein
MDIILNFVIEWLGSLFVADVSKIAWTGVTASLTALLTIVADYFYGHKDIWRALRRDQKKALRSVLLPLLILFLISWSLLSLILPPKIASGQSLVTWRESALPIVEEPEDAQIPIRIMPRTITPTSTNTSTPTPTLTPTNRSSLTPTSTPISSAPYTLTPTPKPEVSLSPTPTPLCYGEREELLYFEEPANGAQFSRTQNIPITVHLKAGAYPKYVEYAIYYSDKPPSADDWDQLIPSLSQIPAHQLRKRIECYSNPRITCTPVKGGIEVSIQETWLSPPSGIYWLLLQLYTEGGANYTEFHDLKGCAVKIEIIEREQ